MNHEDFLIGLEFNCGATKWRCTDVGSRTIVAIRIDQVTVVSSHNGQTSSKIVTDDPSWFNGPPYAVAELVFDEFAIGGCSVEENDFETAVK